jgi:hypothetical protein
MRQIDLREGKYVITESAGRLVVYRNSQHWREDDLIGDNLFLALVQRVQELEDDLDSMGDDFRESMERMYD